MIIVSPARALVHHNRLIGWCETWTILSNQFEMRMLSEHRSRLSPAVLDVNSSLDLDTVLHEIMKSTCGQTGVRYGMISNIDETG
ncbi:MAG: hypothetical protein OXH01_04950 [Bacteroidetes bacterium]|nr:hypothetical protein [Bacteroidota bacterium]